nr:carboxypeptidase regulatory-like domain-containing protein [Deltaproteobacteria bacterium]
MRVVVLSLAALLAGGACGRATPTTAAPSTPPPATLEATVVGPDRPVVGARVRMLALRAAPCPCKQAGLDPNAYYGNEMPECACPEALEQWRSRFARCDSATRVVGELPADPTGRLRLEPTRAVTSLEANGPEGLLWMPWPPASGPIALSLENPIQPRIQITGAPPDVIRGAVLFDDGHCVPIERVGDAWMPRVPVPRYEASGGTLVIEATGFATTVYSLFDQKRIDIELVPATPITGTCAGATVRFDNPFQRLVVKVDDRKQFAIHGALAMAGRVSCWKDDKTLVEEWDHTPGEPLREAETAVSFGSMDGNCDDIKVVDAHNMPIADAAVSSMRDHGGGFSSGTTVSTDARGIACVEDLPVVGRLEITAPQGRCAGETTVTLNRQRRERTAMTVQLRIQPLKGTMLRGRVLAPDGSPVVGANVTAKALFPTNPDDCIQMAAGESGLDGTFSIESLPRGRVVLETEHRWFAKRELTVEHDGSLHEVVIPRGERWTGRLLDPEGAPINACSMSMEPSDGRTLYATCNAGAFDLKPIVPGEAKLQVRIENHALGTSRSLRKTVQLVAGHRREDIQFPRGEHVTGRVVDTNGNALPRAQLAAIPKGAIRPGGRLHADEVQV